MDGSPEARNIIDTVRTACRRVSAKARYVRINYDLICSYAAALPVTNAQKPGLDPRCHYLDHGDETVAFFLILNSINFGSGYFPHLRKRPGMSGYFTVASSLNDYFITHGPLAATQLQDLTDEDCAAIFEQDLNVTPVCELMQLFAAALNALGGYVLETFDGSFAGFVAAANASANRLVELLIQMSFFNDVASYDSLTVPFYKRAQITAADLSAAFKGAGPGYFADLDNLTIFADNLVPHVLRVDDILVYNSRLAERIAAGELIPAGSPEEVELRACAVHAVEMLKETLQNSGIAITSAALDYLLWNRGQQPYYKAIPRHRTRTVFY